MKNAPIVILDEATAFTDPENEDKLQHSIDKLTKGKTLIVIAHRLSTIMYADQILVLEDGQITSRGTHEQLLTSSETYLDKLCIRDRYMGLGASAHSFIRDTRYSNISNVKMYYHTMWSQDATSNMRINDSEAFAADCVGASRTNTYMDNVAEYTFKALRTKKGVVFEDFTKKLKNDFWDVYALQRAEFEMFVREDYAESDVWHIALTRKGICLLYTSRGV